MKQPFWYYIFIFLPNFLSADRYHTLLNNFLHTRVPFIIDDYEGKVEEVKNISRREACQAPAWNNDIASSCRCCIVQEADLCHTKINGTKVIDACKRQKKCNDVAVGELKRQEALSLESDTFFVNKLHTRYNIIKKVQVAPHEVHRGKFSCPGLLSFLTRAYADGKIDDPTFADPDQLQVIDLKKRIHDDKATGMATRQLFLVKNIKTHQEYIVKDLAKGKNEAFDVTLTKRYLPLQDYCMPHITQNFPVLMIPIACLEYHRWGKHIITITHKAPGNAFFSYITDYIQNPSEKNKKRLQRGYKALGVTLANFHKKFMKNGKGEPDTKSLHNFTLVHGDLHAKNIFFDETDDKIYWIDLERLGKSILRPVSPAIDFGYILLFPFFNFPWSIIFDTNLKTKKVNIPRWFADFYKPFLHAYLDTFGGDKKERAQEILQLLRQKKEGDWHNRGRYLLRSLEDILS